MTAEHPDFWTVVLKVRSVVSSESRKGQNNRLAYRQNLEVPTSDDRVASS
jgi:hypothetical protein